MERVRAGLIGAGDISPVYLNALTRSSLLDLVNAEANVDAEKPIGEWNTLDLYVFGDKSVHVVNGVPVLEARNLSTIDDAGNRRPLTGGRIQLQSEGSETFFRDISVAPIDRLPVVKIIDGAAPF